MVAVLIAIVVVGVLSKGGSVVFGPIISMVDVVVVVVVVIVIAIVVVVKVVVGVIVGGV